MSPLYHAFALASESATELKWRLAVLADCCAQHGHDDAATAAHVFALAQELCASLESLAIQNVSERRVWNTV